MMAMGYEFKKVPSSDEEGITVIDVDTPEIVEDDPKRAASAYELMQKAFAEERTELGSG